MMARKPNFGFERQERDKAKAAKKAAKSGAKAAKKEEQDAVNESPKPEA
jgi:hypothetical protein